MMNDEYHRCAAPRCATLRSATPHVAPQRNVFIPEPDGLNSGNQTHVKETY